MNGEHNQSEPVIVPKAVIYFTTPRIVRAQLDSAEYQRALQETYIIRARVKSVMARFLMDHPFGQLLVKSQIVTHPAITEKELQEDKVKRMTDCLVETTPRLTREDAELLARMAPDFQPRSPTQIILETRIDDLAFYRRLYKRNYDPNRDIDHSYQISLEDLLETLPPESRQNSAVYSKLLPIMLMDRKLTHVRDRFYTLLMDPDWTGFLTLVYSQFQSNDVGPYLEQLITMHREFLFNNKHFRAFLFKFILTILITEGEEAYNRFDVFWQQLGLNMSDPNEKSELSQTAFPTDLWHSLMHENANRYFQLQELLESYGIRPR